jgi:uncharacterized protein
MRPPEPVPPALMLPDSTMPDRQLARARDSLRETLASYRNYLHAENLQAPPPPLQAQLRQELDQLTTTLDKLNQRTVRIAVFGLVSRGKSAVLNALVGQPVLATGPVNGVTQRAQVVPWTPRLADGNLASPALRIELIDTPGLDEIQGEARADLAQQVTTQADLILFVMAGDLTRSEYQALCDLRQAQKPLVLVFNKIDLYPEQTRHRIYQHLQQLGQPVGQPIGQPAGSSIQSQQLQQLLSPDEIVLVAADPVPVRLRVEYPDGRVEHQWETPRPDIAALQSKILTILAQEGRSLLALNALTQARSANLRMAAAVLTARQIEAEALIWKFTRYKAMAIAANPIGALDLVGGTLSDLAMIRALAKLYGLPMTRYEAGVLLKTILISSGSLLVAEVVSGLVLGLGRTAALGLDGSLPAVLGAGAIQGAIAGYGSYSVGRAAEVYLERGCTWGQQGASTVIQEILDQVEPQTILWRLRQDLMV